MSPLIVDDHDHRKNSLGDSKSREGLCGVNMSKVTSSPKASPENDTNPADPPDFKSDIEQTIQLGEQFVGVIGDVVDLARKEALLAVCTLPKLMMLWLLIMPVMLLTWCAFSALTAWSIYAVSGQPGLGMLTFFLQQVFLLLVCRWLFLKYRTRMTMPYTRAQIDNLVRSIQHGFTNRDKANE